MPTYIRRNGNILTTQVEDVLLMLNVPQGQYHSLNGLGARIWSLLETATTERALVDALVEEYDVSRDTCAAEVGMFLQKLRERGLLIEDNGG